MTSLLKKPSAWIPIVLSLAMIIFMLTLLSINGVPTPEQNKDEGVGAHLFQIWLVLEFFMIGFFGLKWLTKQPKDAALVLLIQIMLVLIGCAPIFILKL